MAEVARFVTMAEVARGVAVRWVGAAVWAGSLAGVALERVRATGGLGERSIGEFVMKKKEGARTVFRGDSARDTHNREKRGDQGHPFCPGGGENFCFVLGEAFWCSNL